MEAILSFCSRKSKILLDPESLYFELDMIVKVLANITELLLYMKNHSYLKTNLSSYKYVFCLKDQIRSSINELISFINFINSSLTYSLN